MATKFEPDWVPLRRQAKADLIANALRNAGVGPRDAVRLAPEARHRIEAAAAVRTGSPTTWRIAVEMLAGSARARALCRTCNMGDPTGLPGPAKPHGHLGPCAR